MNRLYAYATPAGTFYICQITGCYFGMFENRLIDSYATAERAARRIAANRQLSLPAGIKFDDLGIPANLTEWEEVE